MSDPTFGPASFRMTSCSGRIRLAGGVRVEHALEARRLISGEVLLVHGCHRWAVAAELGMSLVPVEMDFEVEAEDEVWPAW